MCTHTAPNKISHSFIHSFTCSPSHSSSLSSSVLLSHSHSLSICLSVCLLFFPNFSFSVFWCCCRCRCQYRVTSAHTNKFPSPQDYSLNVFFSVILFAHTLVHFRKHINTTAKKEMHSQYVRTHWNIQNSELSINMHKISIRRVKCSHFSFAKLISRVSQFFLPSSPMISFTICITFGQSHTVSVCLYAVLCKYTLSIKAFKVYSLLFFAHCSLQHFTITITTNLNHQFECRVAAAAVVAVVVVVVVVAVVAAPVLTIDLNMAGFACICSLAVMHTLCCM